MGLTVFSGGPQGGDAMASTGEKDWIHANSVACECPTRLRGLTPTFSLRDTF